jgi:hypothetical protein
MMIRPKPAADQVDQADDQADGGGDQLDAASLESLDSIAADAAMLDGGTAPGAAQATSVPGMGNAENLKGALDMAKLMLRPMFTWWPDFEQVWSDGQVGAIANAGGMVCDKHGWNFAEVLGNYGPYIALVAATAPPAMATMAAIKQAKAAAADAERARRNGQPGAPVAAS